MKINIFILTLISFLSFYCGGTPREYCRYEVEQGEYTGGMNDPCVLYTYLMPFPNTVVTPEMQKNLNQTANLCLIQLVKQMECDKKPDTLLSRFQ